MLILPTSYSNVSVFGVHNENGERIQYAPYSRLCLFILRVRTAPYLKRISMKARLKRIGCAPFSFKYGAVWMGSYTPWWREAQFVFTSFPSMLSSIHKGSVSNPQPFGCESYFFPLLHWDQRSVPIKDSITEHSVITHPPVYINTIGLAQYGRHHCSNGQHLVPDSSQSQLLNWFQVHFHFLLIWCSFPPLLLHLSCLPCYLLFWKYPAGSQKVGVACRLLRWFPETKCCRCCRSKVRLFPLADAGLCPGGRLASLGPVVFHSGVVNLWRVGHTLFS